MSPTAEMPVLNRVENVEIEPTQPPQTGAPRVFAATAVFDGEQWSAMCLELDIVADGDTAVEAFDHLRSAVREAIEVANERGISPGEPAKEGDVLAFLRSHHSIAHPVMGIQFTV